MKPPAQARAVAPPLVAAELPGDRLPTRRHGLSLDRVDARAAGRATEEPRPGEEGARRAA